MINQCKICGKEFHAIQTNHIICSAECREINNKFLKNKWRKEHKYKSIAYNKKYYQKQKIENAKNRVCFRCGKLVKYASKKHPCDECVIKDYMNAKQKDKKAVMRILYNRGYDAHMVKDYIDIEFDCN